MTLNKEIRTAAVTYLKGYASLTALVAAEKIHNFKLTPFDMKDSPFINVYTINDDDNSNENDPEYDVDVNLAIEVIHDNVDEIDDIVNQVEDALIFKIVKGVDWGGIPGVEQPSYQSSITNFDYEGATPRASRGPVYKITYKAPKGREASIDLLNTIQTVGDDFKSENKDGSQLDTGVFVDTTAP